MVKERLTGCLCPSTSCLLFVPFYDYFQMCHVLVLVSMDLPLVFVFRLEIELPTISFVLLVSLCYVGEGLFSERLM